MLVAEFLELKCTDMMNDLSEASRTILEGSLKFAIESCENKDMIEIPLRHYMKMRNSTDIDRSRNELLLVLNELYEKCDIVIKGKRTIANLRVFQSIQSFDNRVWLSFSPVFLLFVKHCIQLPSKKHNKVLEDILLYA